MRISLIHFFVAICALTTQDAFAEQRVPQRVMVDIIYDRALSGATQATAITELKNMVISTGTRPEDKAAAIAALAELPLPELADFFVHIESNTALYAPSGSTFLLLESARRASWKLKAAEAASPTERRNIHLAAAGAETWDVVDWGIAELCIEADVALSSQSHRAMLRRDPLDGAKGFAACDAKAQLMTKHPPTKAFEIALATADLDMQSWSIFRLGRANTPVTNDILWKFIQDTYSRTGIKHNWNSLSIDRNLKRAVKFLRKNGWSHERISSPYPGQIKQP